MAHAADQSGGTRDRDHATRRGQPERQLASPGSLSPSQPTDPRLSPPARWNRDNNGAESIQTRLIRPLRDDGGKGAVPTQLRLQTILQPPTTALRSVQQTPRHLDNWQSVNRCVELSTISCISTRRRSKRSLRSPMSCWRLPRCRFSRRRPLRESQPSAGRAAGVLPFPRRSMDQHRPRRAVERRPPRRRRQPDGPAKHRRIRPQPSPQTLVRLCRDECRSGSLQRRRTASWNAKKRCWPAAGACWPRSSRTMTSTKSPRATATSPPCRIFAAASAVERSVVRSHTTIAAPGRSIAAA